MNINRSWLAASVLVATTTSAFAAPRMRVVFPGPAAVLVPALAAFALWNKTEAQARKPKPRPSSEPKSDSRLVAAEQEIDELRLRLAQIRAVQNASLVRYQAMFQELPLPCFTLNEDGHIMEWNTAAENLFGRTQVEVADKPLREILGHTFFIGRAEETIYLVFMGRKVDPIDIIIDGPDGQSRSVKWYPSPVLDARGRVVGVVNTLAVIAKGNGESQAA